MVYSAAKQNPSLSLAWAREPEVGLPRPDRVYFLDLEPEQAEKRGGYGEEKYEKKAFQAQVRRLFLDLEWSDGEEAEDLHVINAGGSADEVGDLLWKETDSLVAEVEGGSSGDVEKIEAWKGADKVLKNFGSFKAFNAAVQNQNQS
jgi:dTMP kinase